MKEFDQATWRIIQTQPAHGAWNMAIDEAILEAVGEGTVPCTLRLYDWTPPCLSLGYAQPISDVNLKSLESLGWELVRRPTGGKAILHTDELTYSVIASHNEPRLKGGVIESYRNIARALSQALQRVQIPADMVKKTNVNMIETRANSAEQQNPVCFDVPSNYELTVGGKKIIGSAQSRRSIGIIQHGTLPLSGDITRITSVLSFEDDRSRNRANQSLLAHATTAESVLGFPLKWTVVAEAICDAFQEVLNLKLIISSLSPEELSRAEVLIHEKYTVQAWTMRI